VRAIDLLLRRLGGIVEFDRDEDAVLRIALTRAARAVTLADGTALRPGDAVIEVHFWNERLRLGAFRAPWAANLRWAATMRRRAVQSLRRLAQRLETDPGLQQVKALHVAPAIAGGRRTRVFARVLRRHGFEVAFDADAAEAGSWLFRRADNLWLWLLAWAFNPRSLRDWRFDRRRREFWMSRARFIALYGSASRASRLG
jgi:hypothetical protein